MTDTQAFVEISSRSAAELAEKYLALWNEPDADRRRRTIAELWTQDGRHTARRGPKRRIRARRMDHTALRHRDRGRADLKAPAIVKAEPAHTPP